jgi:hypothetical protein
MRGALFLFSCVAAQVLACTHPTGSGDSPPPASAEARVAEAPNATEAASRARGLPIATIVTHDAKVSILTSLSGELRVVVRKTADGTLVADGISVDELKTTDPLLHTIVTNAVASRDAKSAPKEYLDATLDRHQPPPSDRDVDLGRPARLR